MVYLNKIYTKAGDTGETMLGNGELVPKTSTRVTAYGTVDELNAALGVLLTADLEEKHRGWLLGIQNDLFDLGADLCTPAKDDEQPGECLRITEGQVAALEQKIDQANDRLEPLESFVLPGGSVTAAYLHQARTICRRAERDVWALHEQEPVNPQAMIYLNRLSDLLFVLGRVCNENGARDVLWVPGKGRTE